MEGQGHNAPMEGPLPGDVMAPEVVLAEAIETMHKNTLYASLIQNIRVFKGDPNEFLLWAQSIDKVVRLMGHNEEYAIRAAFQTSEGYVAEFVQRELDHNPHQNWADLREKLTDRFGQGLDVTSALIRLRSLRKDPNMSYQMFGEELLVLGKRAFPDVPMHDRLVQRELVDAYITGMHDPRIRDKLARVMPDTLVGAVDIAVEEQQVQDRVLLYGGGPMQQARQNRREVPMDCSVSSTPPRYTDDGRPICFYCGKAGHIRRDCYSAKRDRENNTYRPRGGNNPQAQSRMIRGRKSTQNQTVTHTHSKHAQTSTTEDRQDNALN